MSPQTVLLAVLRPFIAPIVREVLAERDRAYVASVAAMVTNAYGVMRGSRSR